MTNVKELAENFVNKIVETMPSTDNFSKVAVFIYEEKIKSAKRTWETNSSLPFKETKQWEYMDSILEELKKMK